MTCNLHLFCLQSSRVSVTKLYRLNVAVFLLAPVLLSPLLYRNKFCQHQCCQLDKSPPVVVLVMQVVPAQYAFVVHTANPITKQKGETFGEVVLGMGEALVGNYPGRALSFSSAPGQQVLIACSSLWRSGMVIIFRTLAQASKAQALHS